MCLFEYQEACKTSFLLRWITISFHCLIHLLHNQKSCIIKVQVNLRLQAEPILHVIIVIFPLAVHYEFSLLVVSFVSYNISSIAEICAFYETYIITLVRVDTFDCSLFFDASYWQAAPRLQILKHSEKNPCGEPPKNSSAFSPSIFNVSLQIIPF